MAITTPETGRRTVDLCATHRADLVEIARHGQSGDRRRKRIYSRDEIERMAKEKARTK